MAGTAGPEVGLRNTSKETKMVIKLKQSTKYQEKVNHTKPEGKILQRTQQRTKRDNINTPGN